MNQGNSLFYHEHIQNNILKLQERKDKYVYHRLSFLKQYCQPIKDKIQSVRSQIKRYQIMRDTQEQVIQNQKDIKSLKDQIAEYVHTQKFFKQKLDEYESRSIQLESMNKKLRNTIHSIKNGIISHKQQLGFHLPSINKKRLRTINTDIDEKSISTKSYISPLPLVYRQEELNDSSVKISKSFRNNEISKRSIRRSYQKSNIQQTYLSCNLEKSIQKSSICEQNQKNMELMKKMAEIRQKITTFNRNQSLFFDCFQLKKSIVQKSVSQLQSKLITNRDEFLKTCNAIGAKQKIPYEEFSRLSVQEIITLFISFSWLHKKLSKLFVDKRKNIMDIIGKLPKIS